MMTRLVRPPSSSGLGHHPLKVAARVQIPLGVLQKCRSAALCRQGAPAGRRNGHEMVTARSTVVAMASGHITKRGDSLAGRRRCRHRPHHRQASPAHPHRARHQARGRGGPQRLARRDRRRSSHSDPRQPHRSAQRLVRGQRGTTGRPAPPSRTRRIDRQRARPDARLEEARPAQGLAPRRVLRRALELVGYSSGKPLAAAQLSASSTRSSDLPSSRVCGGSGSPINPAAQRTGTEGQTQGADTTHPRGAGPAPRLRRA